MGPIRNLGRWSEPAPKKESDWITALDGKRDVTVWLRSGRHVTGTIEDQFPADARTATVFRIKNASFVPNGAGSSGEDPPTPEAKSSGEDPPTPEGKSSGEDPPTPEGKYVLVSVGDIELIDIKDLKS